MIGGMGRPVGGIGRPAGGITGRAAETESYLVDLTSSTMRGSLPWSNRQRSPRTQNPFSVEKKQMSKLWLCPNL